MIDDGIRRRTLLQAGPCALAAAGVFAAAPEEADAADEPAPKPMMTMPIRLVVNGVSRQLRVEPRASLLDTVREQLKLTGTKKGCDHGQCGACTVHVDGRRVVSCLSLAAQADGKAVTTIEGLSPPQGPLHPLQQAFLDHDGLQCGYCTPGQVMAGVACIAEGHAGSRDQIREYMSGNLCRCGCYQGIVDAVEQVVRLHRT
jgi:xanthine dehydrogenase YagT iron-sulfur-binding subunit